MKLKQTKATVVASIAFLGCFFSSAHAAMVQQLEDFEDIADFDGYTLTDTGGNSQSFASAISDFIERTSSPNAGGFFGQSVTGFTGNFIALEDIATVGFAGGEGFLTLDQLTGAYTNISLSYKIAAPDETFTRYETTDFIELQYNVDGGGWVTAAATRYTGDGMNPGLFNGGSNVQEAATTVTANLVGVNTTTSFQVRVHFLSGSQEEMVFDDVTVLADATPAVPEPSSIFLLGLGLLGFVARRKRRTS